MSETREEYENLHDSDFYYLSEDERYSDDEDD